MSVLCRLLAVAVLAAVAVGYGGGGIEAGVPANAKDRSPEKKEQLKDMGKMMLKGPKAYEGKPPGGS